MGEEEMNTGGQADEGQVDGQGEEGQGEEGQADTGEGDTGGTLTGKPGGDDTGKEGKETIDLNADGIDADVLDGDGRVDNKKVTELLKNNKNLTAKQEKQIKDLRRIISQGKAPENPEDYYKDYKPEGGVARYYDFENEANAPIKEFLETTGKEFQEIGLRKDQAKKVYDLYNEALTQAGVFDSRSDDEIKETANLWIAEQKGQLDKMYGNGRADQVVNTAVKFVEQLPVLNEDEKKLAIDLMNKNGAGFINLFYKMNKHYGEGDIPVDISTVSGIPSDAELWDEYSKPETSDIRREEIVKLRQKAGRKGTMYQGATRR